MVDKITENIRVDLYNIKDDTKSFMEKYYQACICKWSQRIFDGKTENIDDAPLVVDIDMRYSTEIKKKQHTKEHIIDAIDIYTKNINKMFDIPENKFKIEVFVMEKMM